MAACSALACASTTLVLCRSALQKLDWVVEAMAVVEVKVAVAAAAKEERAPPTLPRTSSGLDSPIWGHLRRRRHLHRVEGAEGVVRPLEHTATTFRSLFGHHRGVCAVGDLGGHASVISPSPASMRGLPKRLPGLLQLLSSRVCSAINCNRWGGAGGCWQIVAARMEPGAPAAESS